MTQLVESDPFCYAVIVVGKCLVHQPGRLLLKVYCFLFLNQVTTLLEINTILKLLPTYYCCLKNIQFKCEILSHKDYVV